MINDNRAESSHSSSLRVKQSIDYFTSASTSLFEPLNLLSMMTLSDEQLAAAQYSADIPLLILAGEG